MADDSFDLLKAGCPLAEEVYYSILYHIAQWLIVTCCSTSVLIVLYSSFRYLRKWSEAITKEIVFVLYLYVGIYDVGQIFNQSVMLYYRYSAPTPCEAQIPRRFCIARLLGSSVVPSFVVINIAITAQRALSTFGVCASGQKIVSRSLIGVSFLYAIGYGVFTYIPEPMEGYAVYCSSITQFSGVRVLLNINIMFFLTAMNAIATFFLWRHNKNKLEGGISNTLGQKYNRLVNMNILSKNMTIEIVHAVVYLYLFVAYVIVGELLKNENAEKDYFLVNALINIFPLYTLACPTILTLLIFKGEINRKTKVKNLIKMANPSTNTYFSALSKQWDSVGPSKEAVQGTRIPA